MSRIRRDLIVLAASLAVFAGCALLVADRRVGPIERAAFHAVNGLPDWLYSPMLLFQYLGVLAMPLVVAVGALVVRRWRLAAARPKRVISQAPALYELKSHHPI